MKKIFLSLVIVMITFSLKSQVINGGFESWNMRTYFENPTGYPENSNYWGYLEDYTPGLVKSTDAHSGNFAVRIQNYLTSSNDGIGYMISGHIDESAPGLVFLGGIPYAAQPDSFFCHLKYNCTLGDTASVWVVFKKNGATLVQNTLTLYGVQNTYTRMALPITGLTQTPDTIVIVAVAGNPFSSAGANATNWLQIDDIGFVGSGTIPPIPNAGYESWTPVQFEEADYWYSLNIMAEYYNVPTTVTKTTDAHSGSYAMQITTQLDPTSDPGHERYLSMASPCKITSEWIGSAGEGLAIPSRPDSLGFWYKYDNSNNTGDSAVLWMNMSSGGNGFYGGEHFLPATSTYTQMVMEYESTWPTMDTFWFQFASSDYQDTLGNIGVGNVLKIDDIQLWYSSPTSLTVDAGPPQSFTCGDSVMMNSSLVYSGNGNITYSWSPTAGLSNPNIPNPYAKPPTTTTYTLNISDGTLTASDNVVISTTSPNFSIAFSENQHIFISPPFNVLFVNNTPSASNYNFVWSFGDGTFFQGLNPPIHTYPANGSYDVALLAIHKVTGCTDTLIKPGWVVCTGGQNCTHTAVLNQSGTLYGCAGDSVKLSVVDSAGFTYQWNWNGMPIMGANDTIYYAEYNGTYSVTVFLNACPVISAPVQVYFNPPPPQPIITASGTITPCSNDSILLTANTSLTNYLWSDSSTTQTIWVSQSGSYTVKVTAANGCSSVSVPFNVNASLLATPDICIVSVDTSQNENIIIWDKPVSNLIDSFKVYKETYMAGIYDLLIAKPYDSLSYFVDTASQPMVRSERYKISAVDTCGNESILSDFHKTMHLTINKGLGNSYNLIWEDYEGFPFLFYRVYRGTTVGGVVVIDSIPSNITTYTDVNPPAGVNYYMIAVVPPGSCIASKINTNYNSSRSNIANTINIFNVDFNGTPTSGQAPLTVQFNDLTIGGPDTWLWDFGDGNTSTAQNPSHTYATSGSFDVKLIASNSNDSDSLTKTSYITVVSGIDEDYLKKNIKIFPNPFSNETNIVIRNANIKIKLVELYDISGKKIHSIENPNSNKITVNRAGMESGLYIIKITTEDEFILRDKLIVQ